MTRAELLDELARRIAAVARPHPVRVGIDGWHGVGKTTLADGLRDRLAARGRPVIRASIDDFHHPSAVRYRQGRYSGRGYYEDAFDLAALRRRLLAPLGLAGDRRYVTAAFDLDADAPVAPDEREAPPDAILLCDGIFLFRPELDDAWDYRVLVRRGSRAGSLRRALRRAGREPRTKEEWENLWRRYDEAWRLYQGGATGVGRFRRADAVVDNTNLNAPRLLPPYGAR